MFNREIPPQTKRSPEHDSTKKGSYEEESQLFYELNGIPLPLTREQFDKIGTAKQLEDYIDEYMREGGTDKLREEADEPTSDSSEKIDEGRRLVLKGLAATGLVASGVIPDNKVTTSSQDELEKNEILPSKTYEHLPDTEIFEMIEQIREYPSGGDTPQEQIANGKDQITLDKATQRAIFEYWHKRLSPGGNLHDVILVTRERMTYWDTENMLMFAREGMPPCLRDLVIIESAGDHTAESSAKARGTMQFTAEAAERFDLPYVKDVNGNEILVSAFDPIDSARAGAEHLAQSYEDYDHNWWNALSDYNGGYTNTYKRLRGAPKDEQELLSWREENINKLLRKKFDGQSTRERLATFKKLPLEENIDYPAKYFAVLAVLDEMGLVKDKNKTEMTEPELPYKYARVADPEGFARLPSYTIVKGDSLDRIASKFIDQLKTERVKLPYTLSKRIISSIIKIQNKISDPRKIQIGQKIDFTYPSGYNKIPSLEEVASICDCSVDQLKEINPAVMNTKAPLVPGYYPRIPIKNK